VKKVIIVYSMFRMMSIFRMTKKSRKVLHSVGEFERELREEICVSIEFVLPLAIVLVVNIKGG
jgi:uncharacterized membrane protein